LNNTPPLSGSEHLCGFPTNPSESRISDFWRWAFSDLRANDLRGVLAEWLVAQLLGIDLSTRIRDSWGAWDLETATGVRLEVKAAACLQAWAQKVPSRIAFTRLKARLWNPETGYAPTATYNAGLYVFCLQIEGNPETWNALDLSQWRFQLATRKQLEDCGLKSLSLRRLQSLCGELLTAAEFQSVGSAALASIAAP
jgi:hypothetical protein